MASEEPALPETRHMSYAEIAEVQERKEREIQAKYGVQSKQDALLKLKQAEAAIHIQRTYRGYRARREMDGLSLDPASRWAWAIKEGQYRNLISRAATAKAKKEEQDIKPISPANRSDTARSNWAFAGSVARRANADEGSSISGDSSSDVSLPEHDSLLSTKRAKINRKNKKLAAKQDRVKSAKTMDISYFLEMVDVKHRYGSNLRKYHAEWKSLPTRENFFYWLDHGEGKDLELPHCTRTRLQQMQVRYLGRDERRAYEVVVGEKGKLVWRRNGQRVDTTKKYRDSVEGIVPLDDPAPPWADRPAFARGSSESGSMSSDIESDGETNLGDDANTSGPRASQDHQGDKRSSTAKSEKDRIPSTSALIPIRSANSHHSQTSQNSQTKSETHETSSTSKRHSLLSKLPSALQPSSTLHPPNDHNHHPPKQKQDPHAIDNRSNNPRQRQQAKSQKWIFVADIKNNLYIGIKQTGAFQHSSFLHGSRVSVAGLINIRDGQLKILEPRSGHYRTPSHNLHIFLKSLQSRGVDMSVFAISSTYAAMVGIEGFMKSRGKWRELKGKNFGFKKSEKDEEKDGVGMRIAKKIGVAGTGDEGGQKEEHKAGEGADPANSTNIGSTPSISTSRNDNTLTSSSSTLTAKPKSVSPARRSEHIHPITENKSKPNDEYAVPATATTPGSEKPSTDTKGEDCSRPETEKAKEKEMEKQDLTGPDGNAKVGESTIANEGEKARDVVLGGDS